MFDAYTIKKVFPRLVAAAILIQLSWPIFTFLIYLVGQITWGIEGLLYAPFGGAEALELKNIIANMTGNTGAATASVLLIGGAAIGLVSLTLPGVMLMALSALLALLIAFFVLTIRQLVLIILLVTAPIAIVAWILPNTEKVWKVWWESFSKLLLMYPLIILLIAGGKIAAKLASSANTGNVGFKVAIIFISFFGPYFLIPSTFKMAGSAFVNIAGVVNDRSRGVFDRLKNKRQDIGAKAKEERAAGERWSGSRFVPGSQRFASRANKISQGIYTGGVRGGFGLNKTGKGNIEMMRTAREADKMKQPGVQNLLFDDDVRLALMKGSESKAIQALTDKGYDKKKVGEVMGAARAVGFNTSSQLAAFNFEAPNKSRNFVDVKDANGNVIKTASQVMNETVDQVAADTGVDAERLRQGYMYAAGTQGGRLDLRAESVDKVIDSKFDTRLIAGSTAPTWERITKRNLERIKTGTDEEKYRAGAQLLAMQESLAGTNEESRQKFVEIMSQEVDYADGAGMESKLADLAVSNGLAGQTPQEVATIFRTTSSTYSQGTPVQQMGGGQQGQQGQGGQNPGGFGNSDIRLKRDIELISDYKNGFNLYKFKYLRSKQEYVGVMAQEIIKTHPHAVLQDKNGYYYVNYYLLGIQMLTFEEYQAVATKHNHAKAGTTV